MLHVPYIRNKQTNQGDQHINPHFGDREEPLLRLFIYTIYTYTHTVSWESMALSSNIKKLLKFSKVSTKKRLRNLQDQ